MVCRHIVWLPLGVLSTCSTQYFQFCCCPYFTSLCSIRSFDCRQSSVFALGTDCFTRAFHFVFCTFAVVARLRFFTRSNVPCGEILFAIVVGCILSAFFRRKSYTWFCEWLNKVACSLNVFFNHKWDGLVCAYVCGQSFCFGWQ